MKIILSESFIRTALIDLDEGPGLVNRHPSPGGISPSVNRGTEGDQSILDRWTKKRTDIKGKKKKIYQLGIEFEESALVEQEKLRNLS